MPFTPYDFVMIILIYMIVTLILLLAIYASTLPEKSGFRGMRTLLPAPVKSNNIMQSTPTVVQYQLGPASRSNALVPFDPRAVYDVNTGRNGYGQILLK